MTLTSDLLDTVEQEKKLDPAAKSLSRLTATLLPSRRLADLLHGTWLGHPLHPVLTDVPIDAWTSAAALDLFTDSEDAADALVALGVAAAVPTAVSGLADFSVTNPAQQRVGVFHAAFNTVALGCYLASLAARRSGRRGLGKLLGLAGLGAVSVGGLAGGHLAYRQAQGANHVEDVPNVFPSGWHPVGSLLDMPNEQPTRREVGTVPVLLMRRGDDVLAIVDKCSHMGGPLSEGEVTYDRGWPCIQCPWHGSVFRLTDGRVVHGPATAPEPRFETRVVDGQVEIKLAT